MEKSISNLYMSLVFVAEIFAGCVFQFMLHKLNEEKLRQIRGSSKT